MPNPATYTPTSWVNGTTAAQASTMNNLESGVSTLYANTPQTGGANTFTAKQTGQTTLSGTDRELWSFKATDGKEFGIWIRGTSGNLAIRNDTDGIWLLEIDKHDGGPVNPTDTTIYVGTTDPASVGGNTVKTGDVWING